MRLVFTSEEQYFVSTMLNLGFTNLSASNLKWDFGFRGLSLAVFRPYESLGCLRSDIDQQLLLTFSFFSFYPALFRLDHPLLLSLFIELSFGDIGLQSVPPHSEG